MCARLNPSMSKAAPPHMSKNHDIEFFVSWPRFCTYVNIYIYIYIYIHIYLHLTSPNIAHFIFDVLSICILWKLFCSTIKHRSDVCKQRWRHGRWSTDVQRAHKFQLTHDEARSVFIFLRYYIETFMANKDTHTQRDTHTQALVRMSVNTIPTRTFMHASARTDKHNHFIFFEEAVLSCNWHVSQTNWHFLT